MSGEDQLRAMLEADAAKPKQAVACRCSSTWFDREDKDYIVRCTGCGRRSMVKRPLPPAVPVGVEVCDEEIRERTYRG